MQHTYFLYQKDEHFKLPKAMENFLSCNEGQILDFFLEDSWTKTCKASLARIDDPDKADFFVFPYDIGWLINCPGKDSALSFISNLPFFPCHPQRHVFFDYGDSQTILDIPSAVFKFSLPPGEHKTGIYQIWYDIPEHVKNDRYTFSTRDIQYDISFVGVNTNITRKYAAATIKRDNRLKSFFDIAEGKIINEVFYGPKFLSQEVKNRQALFRKITRQSLSVLCLPGIGPLSVRLFETMHYGRIPVILSDICRYPLSDMVPYKDFCFLVKSSELPIIGDVVYKMIHGTSHQKLMDMCELSCRIWHKYFSTQKIQKFICEKILKHTSL